MASKSKLLALLLIVVLPTLACQMVLPAQKSCRVNMPTTGWELHRNGEQIIFRVDAMDWRAKVDCSSGRLVDGQPLRPERAKEILIPVEESFYRLITTDQNVSMVEQHTNGSHVRIDANGVYYLVYVGAAPASRGNASVSYFMGGQATNGLVHLYCYNRTLGEAHTSLPGIAALWTVEKPVIISLICSGRNFVLEVSTEVTASMLSQGPTPIPATAAPTMTPQPPGWHF